MEQILQTNIPEIQAMVADVGVPLARSGNTIGRNSGSHAANIQVALVSPDKRKRSVFEIIKAIRPKLNTIPGMTVFITPSGFLRFLLNFGSSAPIDVEIRGYDLDTGSKLAKEIAAIVR